MTLSYGPLCSAAMSAIVIMSCPNLYTTRDTQTKSYILRFPELFFILSLCMLLLLKKQLVPISNPQYKKKLTYLQSRQEYAMCRLSGTQN